MAKQPERGPWGRPTTQECLQSCLLNAEASARRQSAARLDSVAYWQHKGEQQHWREMAAFYRQRLVFAAATAQAEDDRAQAAADEEDERESPWADLGGGHR